MEGFTEGEFWYWTDDAESKSQPALHVRVIRVAAKNVTTTSGWSPTCSPQAVAAGIGGSILPNRWESECFFRTYKRVVKDVRLVSRTAPIGSAQSRGFAAGVPLLLGQGALALKVGGKQAGRDEWKCSAAEVLREIRHELDPARKPKPRSSFAKRLQQTGRDRRERTGPKMKRQPPRRKKHVAPQPPRLKVLSAEQSTDRSFKPQGSGGLSYYSNMRYFKSRWNPRSALTAAHPSGGPVAGGAIGTSGMPLTASGRKRPPDSDACKQRREVGCHRGKLRLHDNRRS